MKVHFGGSGKGSVELFENYIAIRDSIRELGHTVTRDWLEPIVVKITPSYKIAYQETIKAIKKSDLVILEGSYDTSSVGKQLSAALEKGLPVLILFYSGAGSKSSLTNFVDESSAKLIKRSTYNSNNIHSILQDFFAWAEGETKLVRFNLELDRELDNYLKEKAKKNKTSKSDEIRDLIQKDMQNGTN